MAVIQDAAGGDVDCIFGIAINEQLGDAIIVTVIATGFDETQEEKKPAGRARKSEGNNAGPSLYTQPKVSPVKAAGVTTSVSEADTGDSIPNFFFNR